MDALKSTGLWDGDENDIEGYMAAVQQLTGDTSALMETNCLRPDPLQSGCPAIGALQVAVLDC